MIRIFSRIAEGMALLVLLVSFLSLLGSLYDAEAFFHIPHLLRIGPAAALLLVVLSGGFLILSPSRGIFSIILSHSLGGSMARRLLPAATVLPILLGWFRLQGERAGLYNTGFGVSLTAISYVVVLAILIVWTARSLHDVDTERRRAQTELKNSKDQLEVRVEDRTAELRRLTDHLQTVREEERKRIAREIHDELGQQLTGLQMHLDTLEKNYSQEKVNEMSGMIHQTIGLVRKISSELRPAVLDALDLGDALEWQTEEFQERTGIRCQFSSNAKEFALGRDASTAIFRIFQEVLTNVVRHAQATKVHVDLAQANGDLVLIVEDNGRGIRPEEVRDPKSLGLLGMRERAHLLGGELELEGGAKGTVVTLKVPWVTQPL